MTSHIIVAGTTITEEQVKAILADYPQVAKAQLVGEADGTATLLAETRRPSLGLAPALKAAVGELGVPARVWFVEDGTIAEDAPLLAEKK